MAYSVQLCPTVKKQFNHVLLECGSDLLCEAAVLVVTLGFLEKFIHSMAVDGAYTFAILFAGGTLFTTGCFLKWWRN